MQNRLIGISFFQAIPSVPLYILDIRHIFCPDFPIIPLFNSSATITNIPFPGNFVNLGNGAFGAFGISMTNDTNKIKRSSFQKSRSREPLLLEPVMSPDIFRAAAGSAMLLSTLLRVPRPGFPEVMLRSVAHGVRNLPQSALGAQGRAKSTAQPPEGCMHRWHA